jgi:DUF1680 family protein
MMKPPQNDHRQSPGLTRRDFLQRSLLVTGATGLALNWPESVFGATTLESSKNHLVPFALDEVQLTPGTRLADATLKNAQYLLSLDNDRLLYNFRQYAGVDLRKASPYGGWEAPTGFCRGHFVGHYLSACSKAQLTLQSTQPDLAKKLLDRANDLVAGFAECQKAIAAKTGADYPGHWGYLNAQDTRQFERLETLQNADVPYYIIHKIMAGLLHAYLLAGNEQALTVVRGMADYFDWRLSRLSADTLQAMLNTRRYEGQQPVYFMEFGGMLDCLFTLYRITRDDQHLHLAKKFDRPWFRQMLASDNDQLGENAEHSNTEIPNVLGFANEYEVTKDETYRTAVLNFLDWMQYGHEFATGGVSGKSAYPAPLDYNSELFNNRYLLNRQINGTSGHHDQRCGESCCSHNLNWVTAHALSWTADARWADEYEKRYVNAVLAQQNPDTGMFIYNLNLKQGAVKEFGSPENDFWCCYGTGVEAYAALSDGAYYHDHADNLWISNFIDSTLSWKKNGLTLRQETDFPDSGRIRLTFNVNKPIYLRVHVRIPGWAGAKISLQLNGAGLKNEAAPGKFVELSRKWSTGDVLEISLPFSLGLQRIPDRPEYVAVKYGPQLLVACVASGAKFAGTEAQLIAALTPADKPCEFTAPLTTGTVTFRPINRVKTEPYNGYTLVTQPPAEIVQDSVVIGDEGSEREHFLTSTNSDVGSFNNKSWRDAINGFISYRLLIHAEKPNFLKCCYWGSDVGDDSFWRLFDIIAVNSTTDESHVIATQSLDREAPDQWHTVLYPIPLKLTRGQRSLNIRFQAKGFMNRPGMVGGLFDQVQTHIYES